MSVLWLSPESREKPGGQSARPSARTASGASIFALSRFARGLAFIFNVGPFPQPKLQSRKFHPGG